MSLSFSFYCFRDVATFWTSLFTTSGSKKYLKYKQFKQTNTMYNRQTNDNKKWCDLANLTNVYNSDNIHHYMVDNKSQTLITNTVKYRNKTSIGYKKFTF